MLNGLDLFSGIGGLSIALSDWMRPIAYCEIDKYCQGILLSQMSKLSLRSAPIWDDVRTLDARGFRGTVDIIVGGFPCQDISVAGHGKGLAGERSGLFWEIHRLAKEILPKFIFLENVPAILVRGGSTVVQAITEMGYDCRWCVISAASVGARHKRDRWFLLAHAKHYGSSSSEGGRSSGLCNETRRDILSKDCRQTQRTGGLSSDVADSESKQDRRILEPGIQSDVGASCDVAYARCECPGSLQEPGQAEWPSFHTPGCSRFWEIEPDVGRVADGVPQRVDRLRGLGNAVVPMQAKEAFKILMGIT
jgi:DNA (cytosine-5)-methyltransferase 1